MSVRSFLTVADWSAEELEGSTVYAAEAHANGKERAFVKENRTYTFLAYLLSAFPEARYVFLVRDPRDVALSWKRSPNHPGRVVRAARTWHEDQEQSLLCYGYLCASGRMHLVRYEDLLADAEATIRQVCEFLALPYSADMLGFHDDAVTRENARRIGDWANLERPVLRDNSQKYRTALSELEVRYVEALCQTEMRFLGYALDHPPGDPTTLEHELVRLEAETPVEPVELSADERAIRARRLRVIERICSRELHPARRVGGRG